MAFHWLRKRRRERILGRPFPPAWASIVERNLGPWALLDDAERRHLERLVQVFLAEKRFEGCGGLDLDDEIRVTIAAHACLLLLGLSDDGYRDVTTILVYPSTVVQPKRARSIFDASIAIEHTPQALLGEAHARGPVILVWDAVRRASRNSEIGHNVVFHEFAHILDMLDGVVDGTPPLRNRTERQHWSQVCSRVYDQLRADIAADKPTFLDPYAGHSEAEFFAVATEYFFTNPLAMQTQHSDLYAVLRGFYQQDPGQRVQRQLGPEG